MKVLSSFLNTLIYTTCIFALSFTLLTAMGNSAKAKGAAMTVSAPVYQLRVYEIFDQNKQAFHERFRDHAMRIMNKYDFKIVGMWEAKNGSKTEFVYLLEWPDEGTMRRQWASFMADKEWADIKRMTLSAHGKMVGAIQEKVMRNVLYAPALK